MKISIIIFLYLSILLLTSASAEDIGTIKKVSGESLILRGQKEIPAAPGTRLYVDDIMKTGDNGAMGLILRDDTIIAMGPRSRMILAEFVFKPEENRFEMKTHFQKGTFSYLSGVMSRLSPESVRIETPGAKVAVHDTSFLVRVEE